MLFEARGIRVTPERVIVGSHGFGAREIRDLRVKVTEPPSVMLATIAIMAPSMAALTLAMMVSDMTASPRAWSAAMGSMFIGTIAAITWALWRPRYTVTMVFAQGTASWHTNRRQAAQDLVDTLTDDQTGLQIHAG